MRELRGADALDARAERLHEGAELLHMRLGGGVGQLRLSARQRRAEHEILGGGDGGVVEPVPRRAQRAVGADDQRIAALLDRRAEGAQHLDMRIDLAHAERAALHVILEPRDAEARQQRRHQHDGGAHLHRQPMDGRIEARVAMASSSRPVEKSIRTSLPSVRNSSRIFLHIGDLRHAMDAQRMAGQQRGAENGQHGVLVRGRDDPAPRAGVRHERSDEPCRLPGDLLAVMSRDRGGRPPFAGRGRSSLADSSTP